MPLITNAEKIDRQYLPRYAGIIKRRLGPRAAEVSNLSATSIVATMTGDWWDSPGSGEFWFGVDQGRRPRGS